MKLKLKKDPLRTRYYRTLFILTILMIILNIAQIIIGLNAHISIIAIGAVALLSGWFTISILLEIFERDN